MPHRAIGGKYAVPPGGALVVVSVQTVRGHQQERRPEPVEIIALSELGELGRQDRLDHFRVSCDDKTMHGSQLHLKAPVARLGYYIPVLGPEVEHRVLGLGARQVPEHAQSCSRIISHGPEPPSGRDEDEPLNGLTARTPPVLRILALF